MTFLICFDVMFPAVECGPRPTLPLFTTGQGSATTFPNTVTYTCLPGYRFPDHNITYTKVFQCQPHRQWVIVSHWDIDWGTDYACQRKI